RARLAIYPGAPVSILEQLGLRPSGSDEPATLARDIPAKSPASGNEPVDTQPSMQSTLAMQPKDAAEIRDMCCRANGRERAAILHNLGETPLKPSARIPETRAARAIETLEMAAFASDVESFAIELGESLILPARMAEQVVDDPGGEPL